MLILLELEWNHWSMYQTLKNDNSQINRGSTIKINHFFITLSLFNYIQKNALNIFGSFIKNLKKSIGLYQPCDLLPCINSVILIVCRYFMSLAK